jgi:TetR/AcrR family transcriptional regulator, cholesterol catabolism regulator
VKEEKKPIESDGRAAEVYRTAAQIMLQKGYDATSVSDIARALGITKAGLYHYISGKTQLLFDIMRFGLDELDREVVRPALAIADPEARLRFMIVTHAGIVTRGLGAVTILVDEARALTPAQNHKVTRWKRAYLDLLRGTLEDIKAAGRLRDIHPTVAAFSILGMVNWMSRWYQPEGRMSVGEIAQQIADMAMHGLLRSPARTSRRGLRAI